MHAVSIFNPYTMTDDQILKLNTGQDKSFKWLLSIIQNNQRQKTPKHIVLCGPSGSGKSFLLRRLQIHFKPYKTIACFLFPESQNNIFHPDDLLLSIQSFISCEYAFQLIPKWPSKSRDQWLYHRKTIDRLIKKSSYKHIIICIEHLDRYFHKNSAFSSKAAQSKLRDFLVNTPWLTLITTQRGNGFIENFQPLEGVFHCHRLSAWNQQDHKHYFQQYFKKLDIVSHQQKKIKFNALSKFTGGIPRNAVILADIFKNDQIFSVTQALETSIDTLTPFFESQLFAMNPGHRLLLDALIRGGEPCSFSDLEKRVQANSSEIDSCLNWLVENHVLTREDNPFHDPFFSVTDRLFAHYYRIRHVHIQHRTGMLEAVSEFLMTFYDDHDVKQYADNYYNEGNILIARDLMHISLSHIGLTIKSLPWRDDVPALFTALNICKSNEFKHPKSEKKAIFQRKQLMDLLLSIQFGPDHGTKKRVGKYILGSLFLDEKKRRYLVQKCIQNKLSKDQWEDLDFYFTVEKIRLMDTYGDAVIQLMDYIASGDLIPEIMKESRAKRLKKEEPPIFHLLISFFSQRFSFEISSTEIIDSHQYCLEKIVKNKAFHSFHLEQMGWHKGCLKQFNEAIQDFQQALDVLDSNKPKQQQAWIFSQLGWCHQSLKNYDSALNYHEQAYQYYTVHNDLIDQAWNMGCMGRIYGKLKQYKQAIEKHHEAIDLLNNNADSELVAWNWSRIARNLTRLKQYDEAMTAHHNALEIINKVHNKSLEAWNLEGMAWIYGKINQYDEAIKAQQKALTIRSHEGNLSQQAWNLEGIGWSLGKLERYDEALKVLNRALKIREKDQHVLGQAWNLEGIARYLGDLGHFEEAISAHERALILQIQEKNSERQIWNYRGIAWNYKEMNIYGQSVLYLQKALKEAEQSDNVYWQATLLGLIGWDLRRAHRLTEAITAHEKAVTLYKAQKNSAAVLDNVGQIAINYFILGNTGRAWHILDHYSATTKTPQKMISRIGDAVIYLEKNVRKETAYQTGKNILDGIWYRRRKNWEILPIIQCFFLTLIKEKLDTFLLHNLAMYVRQRFRPLLNDEHLNIIFLLIKYLHSGKNIRTLHTMNPDQRHAIEIMIETLGI